MSKPLPLLIANNFHPETIAKLDAAYQTHKLWLLDSAGQQQLLDELKPACKAVATASWATSALIYQLPKLEIISCFGVGVDGIDFSITSKRRIAVTNTPGVLDDAVADLALALILATQRNLINADNFVRKGNWRNGPFPFGTSLAGKTLGIIGLGNIGAAIVHRALPFKLKIAYHNRRPKAVPYTYCSSINELADISDILLCMLPGGTETSRLINQEVFAHLGPQGTFINVGRGTTVDEVALIAALQNGTIAGAGLDVYSQEPNIPAELMKLQNVVLLPHIGSATVETRRAMGQLLIDNLAAWCNSQPLLTPVG